MRPIVGLQARRSNPQRSQEAVMLQQEQVPSFEQAVLPHLNAAFNLARWLTHNVEDAEDAVQDAYLRAFRFFPGFRGGDVRPWLMKIVRNTCYTWLHSNRPLQEAAEFDEMLFPADTRAPNPEQAALQNADGELVRLALEQLSPKFREVLVLREIEGMSYREIAEIVDAPVGTVMSGLSRARAQLREILTTLMNEGAAGSPRLAGAMSA
jgi:RNA polymerase sigma-70 factor (ECF subfamily)